MKHILSCHVLKGEVAEDGNIRILDLKDQLKGLNGSFRRMGSGSKMALLSAWHCLQKANVSIPQGSITLLQGTSTGNAEESISVFSDSVLTQSPSPFRFSNSISSMMNFHVARHLGIEGPSTLITQEGQSFERAISLAITASIDPELNFALVGGTDVLTHSQKADSLRCGLPEHCQLGEHSSWVLLSRSLQKNGQDSIGTIESPLFLSQTEAHSYLRSLDSNVTLILGIGLLDDDMDVFSHLKTFDIVSKLGHALCGSAAAIGLAHEEKRSGFHLHFSRDLSGIYCLFPFKLFP